MALDWLTTPISDEEPCGPNLDLADDEEFVDYYFTALGRLPEAYFNPSVPPEIALFDPKSVDIAAENSRIDGMLERSRDIRLLVLKAQWEGLAGRLAPMSEAIVAIADVIDAFGAAVHPGLDDGPANRREALNELAQQATVVQPLSYIGLNGPGEVSLRKIKVARGDLTPHAGEEVQSSGQLMDMLGSPGARKRVDEGFAAIGAMTAALDRINKQCKTAEAPFTIAVDPLRDVLGELRGLIIDARPDLRGAEGDVIAEDTDDADDSATDEGDEGGSQGATVPVDTGPVGSHAEARATLEACEAYFQAKEPSSAALLLITQARLLIGKPLIEALETLLPTEAPKTVVEFGPQTGFVLTIDRLKQLSSQVTANPAPTDEPESPVARPQIATGGEAAGALRNVETYFRAAERSSPVPILLQRARSYLDKDFQALVDELIPQPPQG